MGYTGPCKSCFNLYLTRAPNDENDHSGIVAIFNSGLTDPVLLCFRVVQWKSYLSCI